MSNPSNYLRRLRPDLTPYLFHFTNGPKPVENMKSILRQKRLVSSRGYICLTDSPLTMLGEQFKYMDRFPKPMYSQYGIGFTRDVLIREYGCRPVIYGDEDEKKLIEASLLWRYELCRVAQNSQVKKYFNWLDYWFKMVGEDEIKFGALRRYAARK